MSTGKRERGAATRAVAGEIKAERNRRKFDGGFTQRDVAERAAIPLDTYKSIETGRGAIDVDQLFAIAEALGLSASALAAEAERRMSSNVVTGSFGKQSSAPPSLEDLRGKPSAAEPEREDEGDDSDR